MNFTIEIQGTNARNRGAELMAIAIAERLGEKFPSITLAVSNGFGDYEKRARHRFRTIYEFKGGVRTFVANLAIRFISSSIRDKLGVVNPSEVDLILDASGFCYSDQWGGCSGIFRALRKLNLRSRRDTPVIFLPQAFGPFETSGIASPLAKLVDRAMYVFPREPASYDYVVDKIGRDEKIRIFPDFTMEVKGIIPDSTPLPEDFVAIVPNYRMVDKLPNPSDYYDFLARADAHVCNSGKRVIYILHDEFEDKQVVDALEARGVTMEVITHEDPRLLKGVLSKASFVIGSRFHALVGALSSGVPCIGVGWSHKYQALFNDFDCPGLLLSDLNCDKALSSMIDTLALSQERECLIERINKARELQREQTEEMWGLVESAISRL
jgi:polysaccharide pyruvyl transferase WcaK-like protein